MDSVNASWEKFLHPETLKSNLIAISLFITAFENFKSHITEKPESLFMDGFDENGLIIDMARYEKEVLSLSSKKSKLYASLLWFKGMEAIDDNDMRVFEEIKQLRNEVAHEPMGFLATAEKDFDMSKFNDLIELLSKIEKWWFLYFEVAIDPQILPDGVNPDDVISGPIWSLKLMLDIALGNEPESGFYYEVFKSGKTKV